MQIIQYAIASLKYHRRSYLPFLLIAAFITLLLFFVLLLRNTLIDFSSQILALVKASPIWTGNTSLSAQITTSSEEMETIYRFGLVLLSGVIFVSVMIFTWHTFRARMTEYSAMRHSGMGKVRIWGQVACESWLPLIFFSFIAFCLVLLCQTFFQQLFQHIHIYLIDHFDQSVDHLMIQQQYPNQTWMVKMPNRLSTLLQTILLDSKGWFQLVSKSLVQLWGLLLLATLGGTGTGLLLKKYLPSN